MTLKANTHQLMDAKQLLPAPNENVLFPDFPYKERIITTRLGYKIEVRDATMA